VESHQFVGTFLQAVLDEVVRRGEANWQVGGLFAADGRRDDSRQH
jgi:hypothetical protein